MKKNEKLLIGFTCVVDLSISSAKRACAWFTQGLRKDWYEKEFSESIGERYLF